MPEILNICMSGNIDPCDSYGLIATQLARHYARMGLRINLLSLGKREMASQDDEIRSIVNRPILPSLGGIALGYPTNFHHHSGLFHAGPRVAITMFESSKLPEGWREPLNDLDAVIVPSHFCAGVFRDSGVTVPVHVVPLGVSEVYQYQERSKDRPMTFLAFLDRGERKGGVTALQGFLHAFGDDTNYRLILKGRKPKVALEMTNPNIEVIQRDMDEAELYDLYCRCDVLVNPNRGEGFGLIPREFAASGGLAMTTAWGGTADDIDKWGYPLRCTLEKAGWQGHSILEKQDVGEWAKVDPVMVANQLRIVANSWDWFRGGLEAKAQVARQLYSWPRFAEQVLNIWKEAANGRANRLSAA